MHARLRFVALATVLGCGLATPLAAQTGRVHIGPHVTYNFDVDEAAIGGQLTAPIGPYVEFYPSIDLFLVDRGSLFGANADFKFRPTPHDAGWLYLGAGLNITHRSIRDFSHTDTGLNLFMGIESRQGAVHPYGEFRAILGDGSSVQIAGGLNFTLGGRSSRVR
jgi:hypothetical protein